MVTNVKKKNSFLARDWSGNSGSLADDPNHRVSLVVELKVETSKKL